MSLIPGMGGIGGKGGMPGGIGATKPGGLISASGGSSPHRDFFFRVRLSCLLSASSSL